jgi:plasmid replication initiation protein
MDKTPLKMFELAVSLIDTENPPEDQTVYLSKRELFAFFKVMIAINIADLKKPLKKCRNKLFFRLRKNT